MADPRSFADIVASTAMQKSDAARARRNPDVAAEKPRDAILDGLEIVASAIAEDGFTFSHPQMKFDRKDGDRTFRIVIQSDRNNIAGRRAAIWVHAGVYSRAFTAWAKAHRSAWIRPNAPFPLPVWGAQLGALCEPPGWVEWDFADAAKRRSTAEDLIGSIRAGAYPVFSNFEGSMRDVARLADRDRPSPEGILSYLLAAGEAELANETLRRYLDRRPEVGRDFERLRRTFEGQGVPKYRTDLAQELAAFAVAAGYPWWSADR